MAARLHEILRRLIGYTVSCVPGHVCGDFGTCKMWRCTYYKGLASVTSPKFTDCRSLCKLPKWFLNWNGYYWRMRFGEIWGWSNVSHFPTGSLDMIEALLDHGCDPGVASCGMRQDSPLHLAAKQVQLIQNWPRFDQTWPARCMDHWRINWTKITHQVTNLSL